MLQTNYRFAGMIGFGELLAVAVMCMFLIQKVISAQLALTYRLDTLTLQYLATLILIVTPMTFLSTILDINGVSIKDLGAYAFIGAALLILPHRPRDVQAMILAFLIVTYAIIITQYLIGGSAAFYSYRFTGGAKNPNQMALYLCASVVMAQLLPSLWVRIAVVALALFFGMASFSDAFIASAFIALATFVLLNTLSSRFLIYISPVCLIMIFIALSNKALWELLETLWWSADEGNARSYLTLSAIQAWFTSARSMVLGYGAGSFSGISGPFQGLEAHNTAFDLATVAGIFGFFLFPLKPLWMFIKFMWKDKRSLAASLMALIVFSSFHFVGRQPIFWVTLIILSRSLEGWPMAEVGRTGKRNNSRVAEDKNVWYMRILGERFR